MRLMSKILPRMRLTPQFQRDLTVSTSLRVMTDTPMDQGWLTAQNSNRTGASNPANDGAAVSKGERNAVTPPERV